MSDQPTLEILWRVLRHAEGKAELPAPEDVFLHWLLALPEGTDVSEAARREIARLDATAPTGPGLGMGPAKLRGLLVEAVTAAAGRGSGTRSRDH